MRSVETLEQQKLGCSMTESTIRRATGNTESTNSNENAEVPPHCTALDLAVASIRLEAFPGLHLRDT